MKIGLSSLVAIVGFGAKVALRQGIGGDSESYEPARSASDFSGKCVVVTDSRIDEVSCDEPHTGRVRAIIGQAGTCPTSTIDVVVVTADPSKRLCITPD